MVERLAGGIQNLVDVYGPPTTIEGETQREPPRELVAVAQLRAWVAPLKSAVEAWRSLAEERRLEAEALREELRGRRRRWRWARRGD